MSLGNWSITCEWVTWRFQSTRFETRLPFSVDLLSGVVCGVCVLCVVCCVCCVVGLLAVCDVSCVCRLCFWLTFLWRVLHMHLFLHRVSSFGCSSSPWELPHRVVHLKTKVRERWCPNTEVMDPCLHSVDRVRLSWRLGMFLWLFGSLSLGRQPHFEWSFCFDCAIYLSD